MIDNPTIIIAEIGKNFIQTESDQSVGKYLENAKALALAAKKSGADIVKFQTHNVDDEVLKSTFNSPHFSGKGSDRYSWVKRNTEATPLHEFWVPLKLFCEENNIRFMSTPMSRDAAKILTKINVDIWKIGSGDILDFVLLDYLAETGKPILMSSGMSTFEETKKAVNFLLEREAELVLFHCVSKYPCPPEDLNLATIKHYGEVFDIPIGFSDHSLDNNSAVASVALGAKYVEKHFSLSRDFYGSDHKVSQLPDEFERMVKDIRKVESNLTYKNKVLKSKKTIKSFGKKGKVLV